MIPLSRTAILPLCLLAITCGPLSAEEPKPGTQAPSETDIVITTNMRYLQYLPEDYDEQEKWPLLLFLHGAGERGDDLENVKIHGPPKLIANGKKFPMIVISPQCPTGQRWEGLELVALLDKLSEKLKVDPDRIYVTGLSMGGFGTWRLASMIPDRLAAVAPICGGGEAFTARGFAQLPLWAFHGGKDTVVKPQRSEEMIEALKRAGGQPKYTLYPEAGHDSWTETYNNPELYEWMLSHTRKK